VEEDKPAEQKAKAEKSARKTPRVVDTDEEVADNALLGESTLAKMSAAQEPAKPAEEASKPAEETK
jgi:hypothetical protein